MMRRPTSTDVAHGDGERKTTAVFRHSAADSQLSARAGYLPYPTLEAMLQKKSDPTYPTYPGGWNTQDRKSVV